MDLDDEIVYVGTTPIEDIVFEGPTYDEFIAELENKERELSLLKDSAIEKLAKLGLTKDEARAVIGF